MDNKHYFNLVAQKWDDIRRQLFPDTLGETAVATAGDLQNKTAVDLGAGTGFLTEIILTKGARVIAIDHSEEMIRQLRQKFCCNKNVVIRQGEDKNLPLADNSVDFVFANMFLHHTDQPAIALREMARILKPGGRIILTDLDQHNFEFLAREQYDKWLGFKRDDISEWLAAAGLVNISVDCANAQCCSASRQGNDKAEISVFIATASKAGVKS